MNRADMNTTQSPPAAQPYGAHRPDRAAVLVTADATAGPVVNCWRAGKPGRRCLPQGAGPRPRELDDSVDRGAVPGRGHRAGTRDDRQLFN